MKTFLWIVVGLLLVGGVVFALGPRLQVDTRLRKLTLPEDMDAYLRKSEAKFPDIRPGAEKKIVWFDPKVKARTDVSVVFLHGFSATRREFDPLCLLLAKALKANLFYTRLRGHGRTGKAMAEATVNDWLHDGMEALAIGRRLGKKVIVVGSSTGATLGLWLASQPQTKDLLAMILVSPNLQPKNKAAQILLWPWGLQLARILVGKENRWKARNAEQEKYWTTSYPVEAPQQMMGLVRLVKQMDFARIKAPVQMLYCPQDDVIDVELVKQRFPQLGSTVKKLIVVEPIKDGSNHVLAGDIVSAQRTRPMLQTILQFVRPLLPSLPTPAPKAPVQPAATRSQPTPSRGG